MCDEVRAQSRSPFSPGCQAPSGLFFIVVRADFKTFAVEAVLSYPLTVVAAVEQNDIVAAISDRPSSEFTLEGVRSLFNRSGKAYQHDISRGEDML
ncbi:MAG: hypothetical protein JSV78_11460 [Phycisphaerales bacterium]|nr:MAG: hypothetical protein JSV78_11460 [Phycisphaerales bacterium]